MTKAQHKKYARLIEARSRAADDIYKVVNGNRLPFKRCYERAPLKLQRRYCKANEAQAAFEGKMVAENRAWISTGGIFYPHY